GAVTATTLKVSGVDVYSGGESAAALPAGQDEIVMSDTRRGVYRRLVVDGGRLVGAALVGDVGGARELTALLRSGEPVPEQLLALGAAGATPAVPSDPAATVCSCNAVTVGEIQAAIRRDGLTTVAQVGLRTRATTGCGSCAADVQALLAGAAATAGA
ncbi:MAG: nitrite reductase large subunit, partial [Solirubrobacteraceae bacterium]|nr:nitrite reductase large subunit [Solirubrobacteraceae bacterium]